MSDSSQFASQLRQRGIVKLPPLFDTDDLRALNADLNPVFDEQSHLPRSYVEAEQLFALGLFPLIFNEQMQTLLQAVFPDPQIYHCKVYETAANQNAPHINGELLNGWHRDSDTVCAYSPGVTQHVSVFVYLSDVGAEAGAFEILPEPPSYRILRGAQSVEVMGPAGTSFIWNRSFFHRASPNRGDNRRRMLKLSIQPTGSPNDLIDSDQFRAVRAGAEPGSFIGALFGLGPAAPLTQDGAEIHPLPLNPTAQVQVSRRDVVRGRMYGARDELRRSLIGARP